MITLEDTVVLDNGSLVNSYLENLPLHIEVRFPSSTSITKTFGSLLIPHYSVKHDLYAAVPYNILKSHEEAIDPEGKDTPDLAARFCSYNELGLEIDEKPV